MADSARLFTPDELRQYRYKCSHKLAVSLTIGALYLPFMTLFLVGKLLEGTALDRKAMNYGLTAAVFFLLVAATAVIVRRSREVNFSRFLRGCVEFGSFENMLDYAEVRMPEPFSPRFLKYPVHLMILGKVLEQSGQAENAEAGRRMIAAAAEHDPALERFREAPLADLMEYHRMFLEENPEMIREWNRSEKFHRVLVRFILPLALVALVAAFILKGYLPDAKQDGQATSAAQETQAQPSASAAQETQAQPSAAPGNGAGTGNEGNAAPSQQERSESGITPPRA